MEQSLLYLLLGLLVSYLWHAKRRHPLNVIPTVGGPSALLLSYIGAYSVFRHAQEVLQEGYDKYRGRAFKVAMFDRWLVVLSGPELVEQVRKAPREVVSQDEGLLYLTQMRRLVNPEVFEDRYHLEVIRDKFPRQLSAMVAPILDEVESVCKELLLPEPGTLSVSLGGSITMLKIVSRVISRVFVGIPACRNPEYLDAAASFATELVKARKTIYLYPGFTKTFVSRFVSGPRDNIRKAAAALASIGSERLDIIAQDRKVGEKTGEIPNDMFQWLLEEAHERNELFEDVVARLQLTNFGAIHTSANSLAHALFHLLANPDIITSLRKDIGDAIQAEGWTKNGLDRMRKLDSLLKESQRINGINSVSMFRKVLRDFTLADGTYLPAGTVLTFAAQAMHDDPRNYERPHKFEPFRFSDTEASGAKARGQFVSTSSDYIPFGHGRDACPGRFFASLELKAILAYLILNYDMRLDRNGGRPVNVTFGFSILPSRDAIVVFEKR